MRIDLPDAYREEYAAADGARRLWLKEKIVSGLDAGVTHGEVLEHLQVEGWSAGFSKYAITRSRTTDATRKSRSLL